MNASALITGEVIWINGASTGIGRDVALRLAEWGNTVIVSARSETGLQALTALHDNIVPVVFDVTRDDLIDHCREQIVQHSQHLDRVILNAGTCEYLDIEKPDWNMMQRVMTTNYFGAVNSLAVAMPLLEARPASSDNKGAHIVAVVSLATVVPFSRAQAYGASKAALQYFMDSLRVDLQTKKIDVTVINPGFVKTPLTDKNDFSMPFLMPSEQAASRIAQAIAKRPRQYDFPKRLKWLLLTLGCVPAFWNKVVAPSLKG